MQRWLRFPLSLKALGAVAVALGIGLSAQMATDDKADASHNVLTTLVAQNSGKCLSVYPGDLRNGAVAYQWSCGLSPNILIEHAGGGWHYIRFTHSGKCLTVNGYAGWNGATLDQWDCLGQTNQKWSGVFVEGAFELHSSQVYPNKCITVHQESVLDGAIVNQWDCVNRTNQIWRMRGTVPLATATPTRTPTATVAPDAPSITGPASPVLNQATGYTVTGLGAVSAGQTLTISTNRSGDDITNLSSNVGISVTGVGTNSVVVTFTTGGSNVTVDFDLTCTPAGGLTIFASRGGAVGSRGLTCTAPTATPTATATAMP
jgi:hypothetical protein